MDGQISNIEYFSVIFISIKHKHIQYKLQSNNVKWQQLKKTYCGTKTGTNMRVYYDAEGLYNPGS